MARDLLLSLQVSHWLIIAGAVLLFVGLVGVITRRHRAKVQSEPAPIPEPRPQLAPLPELLTSSGPRKGSYAKTDRDPAGGSAAIRS